MPVISLLVKFPNSGNSYILKFNKDITVYDLCHEINTKIKEANDLKSSEYGILVPDPDPKQSFWLDNSRMLSYYHLCEDVEVHYCCKLRLLIIQTMDETRKKIKVDDSKTIFELMFTICSKMSITNYEEYALVKPYDDEEKMRTLTLRKAKTMAKDQEKLEKMKQKLHTDDELNWLAHGKTLRQCGIEESDVLILRRKYFFSDQNVDKRDPVQLNLLYVQLKEAILNGTHPVTIDQAINLAALQCQVELGQMVPEKIKKSPIEIKDHLPKEYVKIKGIDKRIIEQYGKLPNCDDKDSKLRYIQLCRSLPTYGITFFLIKEKLKGRNKLVPRLFGVSKESVMRVDEKTKEILQTWPLTRVRRWAATANLFTLDFGQYSPDGNYVMQTTEGEQIAQLISGYVDIILKRLRSREGAQCDGDEETMMIEENVAPSRANVIANIGATLPRGQRGENDILAYTGVMDKLTNRSNFSEGNLATEGHPVTMKNIGRGNIGYGQVTNSDSTVDGNGFQVIDKEDSKRAIISRIDFGMKSIKEATGDLKKPIYPDNEALCNDDMNTKRWRDETLEQARFGLVSHLGAMTMATGRLISDFEFANQRSNSQEGTSIGVDYTNVDSSMTAIVMNVNGLMQYVRMYDQIDTVNNSLNGQSPKMDKLTLKAAAQNLSNAFLDLMNATFPFISDDNSDKMSTSNHSSVSLPMETNKSTDRPALLEAASRVGDASRHLLQLISQSHASNVGQTLATNDSNESNANNVLIDWEARDQLLTAVKYVANSMADLVKKAKIGALALDKEIGQLESESNAGVDLLRDTQSKLIQAATKAGKCASQLVTCAKVVICTMEHPDSQQQLMQTANHVGTAADCVPLAAQDLVDSTVVGHLNWSNASHEAHCILVEDLHHAMNGVHNQLNNLLDCLMSHSIKAHQYDVVVNLISVGNQIVGSAGDGQLLVRKANILASTVSSLVNDLRMEAQRHDETNGQIQTNLVAKEAQFRADLLEQDVNHLYSLIEECTNGNLQSLTHQQMIISACEKLVNSAHAIAAPIVRSNLTKGLEFATRITASNIGPLAMVGEEVVRICPDNTYEMASELEKLQRRVMPQVNLSCVEARSKPFDVEKQGNLLAASQNLMKCLEDLLKSTDAVIPTITDSGVQSVLSNVTRNTVACLTDLRLCYANSEPILDSEMPQLNGSLEHEDTNNVDLLISESDATMLTQISSTLDKLRIQLNNHSKHLLPDETLDTISTGLWLSIAGYNQLFVHANASKNGYRVDESEWHNMPYLIQKIVHYSTTKCNMKEVIKGRLNVANELLHCLIPIVNGIRGLSAFLHAVAQATKIDTSLSRILNVSHGVTPKRQSSASSYSNTTDLNHEEMGYLHSEPQTQITAEVMQKNLMCIGESCIGTTGQIMAWALKANSLSSDGEITEVSILAEQLNTSVNAVLGYIPGEVTIKRMFALLEDAVGVFDRLLLNGNTPNDSESLCNRRTSADVYDQLGEAARHLAKICSTSTCEVSTLNKSSNRCFDEASIGSKSRLIRLACIADRLTSSLADVLRLLNYRTIQHSTAIRNLVANFRPIAEPVANRFKYNMYTLDGTEQAIDVLNLVSPTISLDSAILKLRDWALQLDQAAMSRESQSTLPSPSTPRQDGAFMSDIVFHMENQCDVSLKRIANLMNVEAVEVVSDTKIGKSSNAFCPILLPVNNLNYPQCCDSVSNLDQEYSVHLDAILHSVSDHNANTFIGSIKSLSQVTIRVMQIVYQAAYLIGAGHPASRLPTKFHRFGENDEELSTVHGYVGDIRKGVSELGNLHFKSTNTDGTVPLTEMLSVAHLVAQQANELCQTTRPFLLDGKTSTQTSHLIKLLERVIRSTGNVFHCIEQLQDPKLNSNVDATTKQLIEAACKLEESVDQYAEVFFSDSTGSATQLSEEAFELQAPLLECSQTLVKNVGCVIDSSRKLISTSGSSQSVQASFDSGRKDLYDTCSNLIAIMHQFAPGKFTHEALVKTASTLLSDLDNAIIASSSSSSTNNNNNTDKDSKLVTSNLEHSIGLIHTSLDQIQHWSGESVDNCKRGFWELMAHNMHSIQTYLPNLVKESVKISTVLSRLSDQTNLNNLTRTILEALDQLVNSLFTGVEHRLNHLELPDSQIVLMKNYNDCVQVACIQLKEQTGSIGSEQGSLKWHMTAITTACSKLDIINASISHNSTSDGNDHITTSSLPTNFIQLHNQLGYQCGALFDSHIRLTESHATQSKEATNEVVGTFVQQFVQIVDTVQSMSIILHRHPQIDTGPTLAQKLCRATQALGSACSEFIFAPLQTKQCSNLINRLDDLKAVLQSCARGANACATTITGLNQLIADLETAALFAQTGTLYESASAQAVSSKSPTIRLKAFQEVQEAIMQTDKGIIQDIQCLIKNSPKDQDALAISSKNCLIRATQLTELVKSAASSALSIGLKCHLPTIDQFTSIQVSLVTNARDILIGLVRLLNFAKTVSTTTYAIEFWASQESQSQLELTLDTKRQGLNETAVQLIETTSKLPHILRSLSDLCVSSVDNLRTEEQQRQSSEGPSQQTPVVPAKRVSLRPTAANKQKSVSDSPKSSVHCNLDETRAVVKRLNEYISSWTISDGILNTSTSPDMQDDAEIEQLMALGQTLDPSHLTNAANEVTKVTIMANNACGKSNDVSMVSDMLRRAAEDLTKRLSGVLQTALAAHVKKSSMGDDDSNVELENTCRRAIAGGLNTMVELEQMISFMIKATNSQSETDSIQVTLAMRRLRDPIFELKESADLLKNNYSTEHQPDLLKPSSVVIQVDGNSETQVVRLPLSKERSKYLFSAVHKNADIDQSIADANETAKDSTSSGLQTALKDMAGELELSVQRIGQLHSNHVLRKNKPNGNSQLQTQSPSNGNGQVDSELDDDLESRALSGNVDAVIACCQHVVHTTLSLMYWAAAAQRELVQQGKMKPIDLNALNDNEVESQWAQGLVSAARVVASAANHLVESAQTFVALHTRTAPGIQQQQQQPDVSIRHKPEALISAAQTTAACTAHLIIACVAKAEPNSKSCLGLKKAGVAVKHSTERLVRIVQMVDSSTNGQNSEMTLSNSAIDNISGSVVSSVIQVIETKSSIAAKQKEVENLRNQLKHINQDQFRAYEH